MPYVAEARLRKKRGLRLYTSKPGTKKEAESFIRAHKFTTKGSDPWVWRVKWVPRRRRKK